MRLSLVSTIGCILLTPVILLVVTFLALLAVVTSTITSSFLFLRFALLAIEMISGLTLESTNWLLSTCIKRIRSYLQQTNNNNNNDSNLPPIDSVLMQRRRTRKLPSSSSLSLSRLPYKATIKSKYSLSVPGTPDPESFRHQMLL